MLQLLERKCRVNHPARVPFITCHVNAYVFAQMNPMDAQLLLANFNIRTVPKFTGDQVNILNESYATNQFPSLEERMSLVQATGLTEKQIERWFCKKRFNSKRNWRTDSRFITSLTKEGQGLMSKLR